jgi:hypothetical protein
MFAVMKDSVKSLDQAGLIYCNGCGLVVETNDFRTDAEGNPFCDHCPEQEEDYDDGLSDVEADSMTLASAGWGTDEDYGYFGDEGFMGE